LSQIVIDTITQNMAELHSLEDVITVLLVRTDGVVLHSSIPRGVPDPELIKSLEWVVSVVPSVSRELRKRTLKKVIYDLENAIIIFYRCSPQILLVTFLKPITNLGLLLIEVSRTARIIEELIT
jgi:predicted regulator of Ras-like GTPase activity (Roadblock/LC7/MglB family)